MYNVVCLLSLTGGTTLSKETLKWLYLLNTDSDKMCVSALMLLITSSVGRVQRMEQADTDGRRGLDNFPSWKCVARGVYKCNSCLHLTHNLINPVINTAKRKRLAHNCSVLGFV